MKIERWVYRDSVGVCTLHREKYGATTPHYFGPEWIKRTFGFTPRKGRWTKFYITKGE